jgi:hypothetical protein
METRNCKYHYIIYTNDDGSFLIPRDKFRAKKFSNSYEIDSPIELTRRKAKLPCPVTSYEDVNGVLMAFWRDGREKKDG